MKLLNGKTIDLNRYAGKVILFVNTASYCGYTSQYKDLQTLHQKYEQQGFTVIAIPCNNFGNQEPGSSEDIQQFLSEKNYGISFPILNKVDAVGEQQNDLFKQLTAQSPKDNLDLEVQWNFEKFLVDQNQNVVARFRSSTPPLSSEITSAIERLLDNNTTP